MVIYYFWYHCYLRIVWLTRCWSKDLNTGSPTQELIHSGWIVGTLELGIFRSWRHHLANHVNLVNSLFNSASVSSHVKMRIPVASLSRLVWRLKERITIKSLLLLLMPFLSYSNQLSIELWFVPVLNIRRDYQGVRVTPLF